MTEHFLTHAQKTAGHTGRVGEGQVLKQYMAHYLISFSTKGFNKQYDNHTTHKDLWVPGFALAR
jgi:hypothetical protein